MPKQSAGILLYRTDNLGLTVLLVHPGGPFWAKKDLGVWSIPKGEFKDNESPLIAAKREFAEEVGSPVPEGAYIDLGQAKQAGGKIVYIWAVQGNLDASKLTSNTFSMEWPPKSGQQQSFPEVDRAAWMTLGEAAKKLMKGQVIFLERLAEVLGQHARDLEPTQVSLF